MKNKLGASITLAAENKNKANEDLQKPLSKKEQKEQLRAEENERTEELVLTKQVPAM